MLPIFTAPFGEDDRSARTRKASPGWRSRLMSILYSNTSASDQVSCSRADAGSRWLALESIAAYSVEEIVPLTAMVSVLQGSCSSDSDHDDPRRLRCSRRSMASC